VTGLAIDRYFFLGVAVETKTHIQINFALSRGLLGQVAVAGGAIDPSADVGCVIKAHVRGFAVVVYAHPGNLFAARLEGGDLLDLGPVGGDRRVTAHADIHAGNACFGPLIDAHVTERARQPFGEVHGMGVSDGLQWMSRKSLTAADASGCAGVKTPVVTYCDGPDARVAREGSTTSTSPHAETPVTMINKQIRQPIGIRIEGKS
jgi:hypothetical protein